MPIARRSAALGLILIFFATLGFVRAAELTTGAIAGTVRSSAGTPIANARITVRSPSGRYAATSNARGDFTILGVAADTYDVDVSAGGFAPVSRSDLTVLPGQTRFVSFTLSAQLTTIATVHAASSAVDAGSTSDTFTVSGAKARALAPPVSSSGLATYTQGTVQGAIAAVPGVVLDPFANAILRGGKVSDAIFDYDSVPIPQGLIAEPGGNIAGAQLATTGVAATTVTLAGYTTQGDNALGGVINEIPAIGTYPRQMTFESMLGAGTQAQQQTMLWLDASPDLRWRYALAATTGSQFFSYGDGHTFYPSEAGTYGLALQSRAASSIESNVHFRLDAADDLSFLALAGEAAYDQYGSPYAGETVGAFDGQTTAYPGEAQPGDPVDYASGVRGSYSVAKVQWLHSRGNVLSRLQLYQSRYGSQAGGPFWDENGWPDGAISLSQMQGSLETGIGYDAQHVAGAHDVHYGAEYRTNTSFLNQVVPTADEIVTSNPTLFSYLAYAADTWRVTERLTATGALRFTDTHVVPGDGSIYDDGALDPHLALAYRVDSVSARITYDRTTVAPLPLEADRVDSSNVQPGGAPAPFVPLAPEVANNVTYTLEGGSKTRFRATAFNVNERNLIDVLPYNFRSSLESGLVPNGVGVPTNAGDLRARGLELWLERGGFTVDATYTRAYSSSASQFAYNDLNAPAVAAGALFPVSYIPNLAVSFSYELRSRNGRIRVTPSLSFESGYPYGNGRMVWIFNPSTGKPEEVPNDNYVDPGYNYYFLKNPALPYNASSNPYIASLGTPEGSTPNTLHAPPETFVNLHAEADVTAHVTASIDVVNLLGNAAPTSFQGNPYLIGPPGYAGGNPLYAAAYETAGGYTQPYTLGNGVPTNNGQTQSVPWTYGRAGYVPQNYPAARTVQFRLRFRL